MLSIRLRRTGSTKRPYYRVVVADSRDWRDGRFVEVLGHYDPRREPGGRQDRRASARSYWIGKGAQASDTVRSLLKRQRRADGRERRREASACVTSRQLARGLVREPGRVRVHEHVEDGRTVLELSVAPADRGRVIGREGRTADALRTLVDALARAPRRGRASWRSSTDAALRGARARRAAW